jgi:hypothetical protein
MAERPAFATDWLFYPDWLDLAQASYLSGWDLDTMQEIVNRGGVDQNTEGLISKADLWTFQECLAEALHWKGM